ncbi:MAG TPA: GYD domain-containing protein [Candidatus Limnocylindrales bacterium]
MAMFIVLGTFTDGGVKTLTDLRKGVERNLARGEQMGIKVHGWYLTQGQYDFVVVAEGPDAETMLAQAAGVSGAGLARVQTLRAFTLDEADAVFQRFAPAPGAGAGAGS